MTSEELKELIRNGPTEQMVAALSPLTDAQRKKLSKAVVDLRKLLTRTRSAQQAAMGWVARELLGMPAPCPYCGKTLRTPKAQQCFECGKAWHVDEKPDASALSRWTAESEFRLQLALLGVAGWGEAKRIRVWNIAPNWGKEPQRKELVFRVLQDRKPDWLPQWIDEELEGRAMPDWVFLRRLIRADLCPAPQSDRYIVRMIYGIFSSDTRQSLKERLLDDPSLLANEIWRIFEISPVRETILHVSDITSEPAGSYPRMSWGKTLAELASEGTLDRRRLLTASLASLLRNTDARNTVWFHTFHELLEPTLEERQALQPTYFQLLSHPVPGVVGMALDALAVLEKAKALDVPGFLAAVGPVFHLRPKAQPLAAMKLLTRAARANKELAPTLAEALLSGLSHPAVAVQEALIEALSKVHEEASDLIAARLPAQIESISPSLQEEARRLLAKHAAADVVPVADAGPPADLVAMAGQVASPWREAAGVDSLLKAVEENGELSAVSFDPIAVPRLYEDQRVEPIRDLDELIARLTVAVEGLNDPIEFELLVDGLSRLCAERPEDFEARVAPLLLRIEKKLPPHASLAITDAGLNIGLFRLVLRWCGRDVRESREGRDSILGFLDVRLGLVALRLRKRQPAPLLACPTHRPGWIDPLELAARLEDYQQRGLEPSQHDFIQGILRLAPDNRSQALARCATLQGKYAAAFRYALGGALEDSTLPGAVLVAIGRARHPLADLTELEIPDAEGPDGVMPARYSWTPNPNPNAPTPCPFCGATLGSPYAQQCFVCGKDWHDANRPQQWTVADGPLRVTVEPGLRVHDQPRDVPSVLLHGWRASVVIFLEGGGVVRWVGTVWPANLNPYFSAAVRLRRSEFADTYLRRQRTVFLEALFDPDVPFSEMAQVLVALSLVEQVPEVTGLAIDALVELIRDGRCVGGELGGVFARLLSTTVGHVSNVRVPKGHVKNVPHSGLIKLNRLGKHLETVARASLLHAHVCAEIVQASCATLAEPPRDIHHLLGPLNEWLSALEEAIRPELRPLLEKVTSGKSGALAKKLLQLPSTVNKRGPVLMEALQGRLQRCARWSGDSSLEKA